MKSKNLFLATILVAFGAINESVAQANSITIGWQAGASITSGGNNVFIGVNSGPHMTSGLGNVFVGCESGRESLTGNFNTFIGNQTSLGNSSGTGNTSIGSASGYNNTTGQYNTNIGFYSGIHISSGLRNSSFGYNSGWGLYTGSNNTFLGSVNVGGNSSISNSIILADGDSNQRLYIHSNGFTGIGLGDNVIPQNRLEVKHGTIGNSGLRFTNLKNSFVPTTSSSKFLTVDANGDVILQNVSGSGGSGSTTITAGQNIVVTGDSTAGYTISSPTTNTLVNNTNTLTSTVNGVVANAPIVNTVVNSIASGQLTTTVNGVSSVPVVLPATFDSDAQTLTITGDQLTISNGNTVTLPTLTEVDGSVTNELQTLTESPIQTTGTAITLSNGGGTVYVDGSETKIQAGTNVTVTGNGTIATPYIINSTATGNNCNIYSCDGTLSSNRVVTMANNDLIFNTTGSTATTGGRVYIGNTTAFTAANFPTTTGDYRLYVEGGVLTEKVKVALRSTANWADYVFANDYKLMPLNEVEAFVKSNKHLPGISSADKLVNEGLDLGEMQGKQMEKIEELTLYAIEQNKKIEKQEKEIEELKVMVKSLIDKK